VEEVQGASNWRKSGRKGHHYQPRGGNGREDGKLSFANASKRRKHSPRGGGGEEFIKSRRSTGEKRRLRIRGISVGDGTTKSELFEVRIGKKPPRESQKNEGWMKPKK